MPLGSTLALLFRIDADSSEAVEKLRALQEEFDRLAKQNWDAVKKGISDLGNLVKDKFAAASDVFHNFTSSLTGALGPIGQLLEKMGPLGTAFAAAAGAMQLMLNSAIEVGTELQHLSEITGFTVEQLSGLRVVAAASGTNLDTLTFAVVRFQRSVETGGTKAQDALAKFNITQKEVETDGVAALTKLAANMDSLGSTSERNAALMAIMGRSATQQIPFLEKLAESADNLKERTAALGLQFDREFAQTAERLGSNLKIIKLQAEGVGQAFAGPFMKGLIPATEASERFNGALIKMASVFGNIFAYVSRALNPFERFAQVVNAATEAWRLFELQTGRRDVQPKDVTSISEADKKRLFGAPEKVEPPKGAPTAAELEQLIKEQRDIADQKAKNKLKCFLFGDCKDYLSDIGYKKPKEKKEKIEALVLPDVDPTVAAKLAEQQAEVERLRKEGTAELDRELKAREIGELEYASEVVELETKLAQKQIGIIKAQGEAQKDVIQQQAAARIKFAEDQGDKEESARERQRARLETRAVDIVTRTKIDTITSDLALKTADVWDNAFDKLKEKADAFRAFELKASLQLQRDIQDAVEIKPDTEGIDSLSEHFGVATKHAKEFNQAVKSITEGEIIANIHQAADAVGVFASTWRTAKADVTDLFNQLQTGQLDNFLQLLDLLKQRLDSVVTSAINAGQGFKALGAFITQLPLRALQLMPGAIKKLTDAFIETGHTGPAALRQFAGGILKALGEMASYFAEMSFASALFWAMMGEWHKAALATAAGIGFEALAIALGFVANKVSPGEGGAAGGVAVGSTTPPQTTINIGGAGALATTPGQAFGAIADSINKLNDKIDSMSPGDVVTVAAKTAPNAFANGVTNATRSNATFSRQLGLTLLPSS